MQTPTPLVDVVIPVYNRSDLAIEAIESVLKQTYPNINLYIIEDGSNSLQPSLPFFKKKENIFYTRLHHNHGVSYCRNLGSSQGKGKYVAFLDSDDLWAPEKIEKQTLYLEEHPNFKWIHTNELWIKNGNPISQKKEHLKQGGIFFEKSMERCLISPSSVMFKRDFFEQSGGFHTALRVAEDYELWLRLNLKNPIAYLEDNLTIKRAGDWSQLSRTVEIDRWRVLSLHRIFRMYKNEPEFQPWRNSWKRIILKKIQILCKGAQKYNHLHRVNQYQNWSKVFNTF